MPRTLYRAAARATIAPATFGRGACFAESLADAERYTRNPGFGGEHLFSFDVEAEYVCHATGRGLQALVVLATELEYASPVAQAERWGDRGLGEVFEVVEGDWSRTTCTRPMIWSVSVSSANTPSSCRASRRPATVVADGGPGGEATLRDLPLAAALDAHLAVEREVAELQQRARQAGEDGDHTGRVLQPDLGRMSFLLIPLMPDDLPRDANDHRPQPVEELADLIVVVLEVADRCDAPRAIA